MERKIVFLEEAQVVALAWRGRLTGKDIANALRTIYSDPRWRDDFDTVWIYDELVSLEVTPAEVNEIYAVEGAQSSSQSTGADVAVVRREVDELLAHYFLAMAARMDEIVRPKGMGRSIEEALASVGTDSGRASRLREAVAQAPWDAEAQRPTG